MKDSEDKQQKAAQKLLDVGSAIAGNVASAAAGFLAAGPAGMLAASALAPMVSHTLREIGAEIHARMLGPREEIRAGAALAFAAAKIDENLKNGRDVRNDGFFDEATDRSAADEIAEAALLAAQRDPEEKKTPFYGTLLGNLAFHPEIDRSTANLLIRLASRLSYQQLVLLVVVFNQARLPFPQGQVSELAKTPRQIALFQELLEMYTQGLLGSDAAVLDLGGLVPSQLKAQGLALQLYALMELHKVNPTDIIGAVATARGEATT